MQRLVNKNVARINIGQDDEVEVKWIAMMGLCYLVAGKCGGHSMLMRRLLFVVAAATAADALSPGAGVVALGPGASEVKLIAAKLAAKASASRLGVQPAPGSWSRLGLPLIT